MRAPLVIAAAGVFAAASLVAVSPSTTTGSRALSFGSDACAAGRSQSAGRSAASRSRGRAAAATGIKGKVAVQPIDGPANMSPLRALVVRIVRGRGFRTVTNLPRYEGTGQYPGLARDHHLAAFVTADVEDRGQWQRITFLVWNGATGSVLGRWTASGPARVLPRAVGRGFWAHLGPAMLKAEAPASAQLDPAPPMRIDASDQLDPAAGPRDSRRREDRDDESVAQR
jgi:hypothetical protein